MNTELIRANQSAMKIRRINRQTKLSYRFRLAAIAAVSTARAFPVQFPNGVNAWAGYWKGYTKRSTMLHTCHVNY